MDSVVALPKADTNLEQKFFNNHPTNNPVINSVKQFVRGENNKHHFIEDLTERIGFPYWDKAMVYAKPSGTGRGATDSNYITYIPFVRDSQNFINASLIVKTTATDTTFRLLYDWQYDDADYGLPSIDSTAENISLLFMALDQNVFGHLTHQLTDSLLFEVQSPWQSQTTKRTVTITNSSTASKASLYVTQTFLICIYNYHCTLVPGFCTTTQCDNCLSECVSQVCFEFEATWWEDEPSGGGTGTGGTGTGTGGGWNDPCGSNPYGRSSVYAPGTCGGGGGWIPLDEPTLEQLLQQWDDNIIIDPSVRPCVNNIINQIRNLHAGTIAGMIYILSQQIPGFDWEIKEVAQLPAPYINADALTTINANNIHHSVTELNQSKLTNSTNISLARTILHEAIHAFIYDYINSLSSLTQAQKDQILSLPFGKKLKQFIKLFRPGRTNDFHNAMALNFHNDIRDALKELCPIMGITLTGIDLDLFCSDMAWGGLQDDDPDSPWSALLTSEDRARINKRLEIELNNIPSFSGFVPMDGSNYYVSLNRVGTKACP